VDEKSFVVPPDPRIGTVVRERYRIVRLLGEGGMGAVYEGEHLLIRRRCAIKFLHAQYARTPAAMTRFRREALAATSIGNPHVVQVTDMDQAEDGSPYMVLEYLEGRSLAEEVESRGPMTLVRALHIMRQLCNALGDVHAKGITHRDLKPENLFLVRHGDDPDFLKILDFGISKFTSSDDGLTVNLTKTGAAVGSVYFMSPEQARGIDDVDRRADIYAVGGCLYFLLTGRPVFEGDSLPHMLMQIVTDPPPRVRLMRPDVPEGVEACLMRMLHKDRERRFQDSASLWEALKPYALQAAASPQHVPELVHSDVFARYSGSTTPLTPLPATAVSDAQPDAPPAPKLPVATLNTRLRTMGRVAPWLLAIAVGGLLALRTVNSRAPKAPALTQAVEQSTRRAASLPAAQTVAPKVRLTVRVKPAEAELVVNGMPVKSPYQAELPRSSAVERVQASLEGYEPVVRELSLERDRDLTIELTRVTETAPEPVRETKPSARKRREPTETDEPTQVASSAAEQPAAPVAAVAMPAAPVAAPVPAAQDRKDAEPTAKPRDIKRIRLPQP
jgi:serine/threonine protein kinase